MLSALTVGLVIAFAFFMADLVTRQMSVELLDMAYSAAGNSTLTLYVRNRGTRPVTIVLVEVDGKPYTQNVYVQPGGTATVTVPFGSNTSFVHKVRVVTSSGAEYNLLVKP